jgi:hypothetical protein
MPVQTQMQVRRGTASSWTSTNPTLAAGELGFETDTGKFKIGTGASTWTALPYAGGGAQATFNTFQYTATAGQTTFSGADSNSNTLAYTVGAVQVYLNGALLANTADYTASNGTSVVLAAGALVGDSLTIIAFGTFTVADTIPTSAFTAKGQILVATGSGAYTAQAVGSNGQILTANSAQADGVEWVTPASGVTTFTLRKNMDLINGSQINDIIFNGSNLYVAVGQGGSLYTSTNGTSWTQRTSGFGGNEIASVAFGAGVFVIVGQNGNIASSTDGTTWTLRTSNVSTNRLRRVRFANSLFVAVGDGANGGTGGITTSPDGTTWTKRNTPTTSVASLYDVNFGGGNWVTVGGLNTRAGYYSADAATWTLLPASLSNDAYSVFYANSTWWTYPSSVTGTLYYASDPAGTWASPFATIGGIWQTVNTRYSIYNNNLYSLPSGASAAVFRQPLTATDNNGGFDDGVYSIDVPLRNINTNGSFSSGINVVYVNPTGGILLGDNVGRIYTSF